MNRSIIDRAEKAVIKVLQDVRPELLAAYGKVDFETKKDKTIVTHLDKMVEERLKSVLREIDPAIGILGEELGREGNADVYWLLDPIDGTEQFARGVPTCKNLACLMENGQPVWALMYMFVTGELFLARRGEGVTLNGKKIKMTYRPLERCWVEVGYNTELDRDVEVIKSLRRNVYRVSRMHDFASLVLGKMDGFVFLKAEGGLWDWGPRVLLYEEAGGKIAHAGHGGFDWSLPKNMLVGAHAKNFDELMRIVEG